MEQSAYAQVLNYIKEHKEGVTPHELSITLGKSRVTIQSSLKRLMKNGWVIKEGASPKTSYKALDLLPKLQDEGVSHVTVSSETGEKKGFLEDFIHKTHKI